MKLPEFMREARHTIRCKVLVGGLTFGPSLPFFRSKGESKFFRTCFREGGLRINWAWLFLSLCSGLGRVFMGKGIKVPLDFLVRPVETLFSFTRLSVLQTSENLLT